MGLTTAIPNIKQPRDTNDRLLSLLFFVCLGLILVNRCLVFFSINVDFIDSDQPFLWIGAHDYSKFQFYEPRFYGQDYNTFMEGLFAVPFLWLGLPVYYAVPLATHLIYLFPFVFTAGYLFRKQRKEQALMVLAIVLCLPSGYDILTSLPRGFVSGLFFTSFFVLSFLNPHSFRALVLNTLMCAIAYFVNPNSVIVSVPFQFYLFLHHYQHRNYYLTMAACALSLVPLHLFFNQFYINHPEYVVFELVYSFSPAYIWENLKHLDQAFQHLNFFVEDQCWLLLAALLAIGVVSWQKNRKLFYALVSLVGIILVSFCSGKVRDGAPWPFYSYSRMYLGIPLLMGLLLSQLNIKKLFLYTVLSISVIYSAFKIWNFDAKVAYHTERSHWLGVHLVSLKNVKEAAELYRAACQKHQVDRLIISNGFWLSTYLNYGGPAIYPDFPQTEETNSERRYYVREPNKNKVFSRFLFISTDYQLDKKLGGRNDLQLTRLDDYGLFLVSNNRLPNHLFMKLTRAAESL